MPNFTKKEKMHIKLCVLLASSAILFQSIGKVATESNGASLLYEHISKQIDEITESYSLENRKRIIREVQVNRIKLIKSVKFISVEAALIGSLRALTDGTIKTKKGTRLDWIIQTLRETLPFMEKNIEFKEQEVRRYKNKSLSIISSI